MGAMIELNFAVCRENKILCPVSVSVSGDSVAIDRRSVSRRALKLQIWFHKART